MLTAAMVAVAAPAAAQSSDTPIDPKVKARIDRILNGRAIEPVEPILNP